MDAISNGVSIELRRILFSERPVYYPYPQSDLNYVPPAWAEPPTAEDFENFERDDRCSKRR
jgi:hypothetical protein